MVSGAPLAYDESHLDNVRYNADGLVPAVVQDVDSRRVLMLGWMNDTSLRRTLDTGRSWFWSRSRQEYWCKGETSGDRQYVRRASYDCDGDTILLEVEQTGRGACHTGAYSCFFRSFGDAPTEDAPADDGTR